MMMIINDITVIDLTHHVYDDNNPRQRIYM